MIVNAECACGSRLEVDDASEIASTEVLKVWHTFHDGHRKTLEEFKAELAETTRRMEGAVGLCGHALPPLVPGGHSDWCHLRSGHIGMHESETGAHWTEKAGEPHFDRSEP